MARDPPKEVVDSWPEPNTDDPENRGLALVLLELILLCLVMSVLALRLYARLSLRRIWGADDWCILPACLFYFGLTVCTVLANLKYGWGKHAYDVPPADRETGLFLSFLSEMFLTLSLSLTKLSLCIFYLRLLSPSPSRSRRFIYILMGIIIVWGFGFTIAIVFQCHPVKAVWKNYPGEHCINQPVGLVLHASLDIVTDFVIYVLPIPKALSVMLPRRQKVLICVLFALGGVVCTASVVRLPFTLKSMASYDTTWHIWYSYIWSVLECGLAIICASLPSLTVIFLRFFPSEQDLSSLPSEQGKRKSFPSNAVMHSYPLADISTTATCVTPVDQHMGHWWGTGRSRQSNEQRNESEENIIERARTPVGENGRGITKTTVIQQTVEGTADDRWV